MRFYLLAATVLAVASAQQYTTPVPILKQINKHNEDGSYSYGYEAADGTYKIESKYPDGEVFGKYGYIDDQGKLRTIEYGASKRGFEPAGNEIQVPPPTLRSSNEYARPLGPNEEDDGQYREDPSAYYNTKSQPRNPQTLYNTQRAYEPQSTYRSQSSYNSQPTYNSQPSYNTQPAYDPQPAYNPQPTYRPPTAYRPQPAFRPQSNFGFTSQPSYYNPPQSAYPNYHPFQGHPATNVDINTGSYSVNYRK